MTPQCWSIFCKDSSNPSLICTLYNPLMSAMHCSLSPLMSFHFVTFLTCVIQETLLRSELKILAHLCLRFNHLEKVRLSLCHVSFSLHLASLALVSVSLLMRLIELAEYFCFLDQFWGVLTKSRGISSPFSTYRSLFVKQQVWFHLPGYFCVNP